MSTPLLSALCDDLLRGVEARSPLAPPASLGGLSSLGAAALAGVTPTGNDAGRNGGGLFKPGAVASDATATPVNVTVDGAQGGGGAAFEAAGTDRARR